MRDKADADGSDFLLVDTGDRVEGNAIYDSSKPRGKLVGPCIKYTWDLH
jgi:2',3'-cyclic-nucleotide 2'-phosphodiesterase (5'-nucleotidase family)